MNKNIKLTQFLQFHFLSHLEFTKDKQHVCFVETQINQVNKEYEQRLSILDVNSKTRQVLTKWEKEISYFTLQEGILLKNNTPELLNTNYSFIREDGIKKSFTLPFVANDIRDYDETHYLISATTNRRCPSLYKLSEEERKEEDCRQKEDKDYVIFDEYPFVFNGAGVVNGDRQSLFLYDKTTKQLEKITSDTMDVESYDVNGQKIVFVGNDFTTYKTKYSKVYEFDGTKVNCLFEEQCQIDRAWYENDEIKVLGTFAKDYGAMEYSKFYTLKDGKLELEINWTHGLYNTVTTDCKYGSVHQFNKDGQVPYFLSTKLGNGVLYRKEKETMQMVIEPKGSVDDFAVCDGKIYCIAMLDQKLQEVYCYEDGKLQQLTKMNEEILEDCYVAIPEEIIVEKAQPITGWVLKPKDYDETKTYPMILDIHGGPRCAYGTVYVHEMQVWASEGYFVVFANPRGSDGYDNDFMDLRQKYGTIDYEDLMDFVDTVLQKYPQIDKERMGVTGGSYGGYMTNWIIGHTNRFKAAATQRSISNWISEVTSSDYGVDFPIEHQFEDIMHCEEGLWRMSPLKYASNIQTPTLFIHSLEDYRCPVWEGIQLYSTMKMRGIESKMVLFKGENHELSRSGKPKHRVRRLEEITMWLDSHLKG